MYWLGPGRDKELKKRVTNRSFADYATEREGVRKETGTLLEERMKGLVAGNRTKGGVPNLKLGRQKMGGEEGKQDENETSAVSQQRVRDS